MDVKAGDKVKLKKAIPTDVNGGLVFQFLSRQMKTQLGTEQEVIGTHASLNVFYTEGGWGWPKEMIEEKL